MVRINAILWRKRKTVQKINWGKVDGEITVAWKKWRKRGTTTIRIKIDEIAKIIIRDKEIK